MRPAVCWPTLVVEGAADRPDRGGRLVMLRTTEVLPLVIGAGGDVTRSGAASLGASNRGAITGRGLRDCSAISSRLSRHSVYTRTNGESAAS